MRTISAYRTLKDRPSLDALTSEHQEAGKELGKADHCQPGDPRGSLGAEPWADAHLHPALRGAAVEAVGAGGGRDPAAAGAAAGDQLPEVAGGGAEPGHAFFGGSAEGDGAPRGRSWTRTSGQATTDPALPSPFPVSVVARYRLFCRGARGFIQQLPVSETKRLIIASLRHFQLQESVLAFDEGRFRVRWQRQIQVVAAGAGVE